MGTHGSRTYVLLTQWGFSMHVDCALTWRPKEKLFSSNYPLDNGEMDGDGEEETHLWAGGQAICGGEETNPEGKWSFSSQKQHQEECEALHMLSVLLPSRTWTCIVGS